VLATALSGGLLLVANGQVWADTTVHPAGARQHLSVTGHAVAPALSAIGVAALALAVAMLASNGILRRIAGLLTVVVGAATVPVAISAHGDLGRQLAARAFGSSSTDVGGDRAGWWIAAVIAGSLIALAGMTVTIYGARWRGLGSRYDAPGAQRVSPAADKEPSASAWDALDRGQDPTESV
jgi:uncharacterized membrane protein (TIGR02234 family)